MKNELKCLWCNGEIPNNTEICALCLRTDRVFWDFRNWDYAPDGKRFPLKSFKQVREEVR